MFSQPVSLKYPWEKQVTEKEPPTGRILTPKGSAAALFMFLPCVWPYGAMIKYVPLVRLTRIVLYYYYLEDSS